MSFRDYEMCPVCHSTYKPVGDVCMICCDKSARQTGLTENPYLGDEYGDYKPDPWLYGLILFMCAMGMGLVLAAAFGWVTP